MTLGLATSVSQLLTVLLLPLVTRLVSPVDYGFFAAFLAFASILSVAAAGRYEMAIVLARTELRALQLLTLSIAIGVLYSISVSTGILIISHFFELSLGHDPILLGILIFSLATKKSIQEWLIRGRMIYLSSSSEITSTIITLLFQIALCYINPSWINLVLSVIIGNISFILIIAWRERKGVGANRLFRLFKSVNHLYMLIRKYRSFPIFSAPAGIINSIGAQGPVVILPMFFPAAAIGQIALSSRVVRAPTTLVSTALGRIIAQRLAFNHVRGLPSAHIIVQYTRYILFTGILLSIPAVLYGQDAFALLFGERWREAGIYFVMLLPMIIMNACTRAVSKMFIYGKNNVGLVWQVVYTIVLAITLCIGGVLENIYLAMGLYSAAGATLYAIHLGLTLRYAGGKISDIFLGYKGAASK